MDSPSSIAVDLVFRTCTLDVLDRACGICGLDPDAVLSDLGALDALDLPLSRAQAFLDVVLREPVDLRSMPLDQAEAVAGIAAADFFLDAYRRRWKRHLDAFDRFMSATVFLTPAARGGASAAR